MADWTGALDGVRGRITRDAPLAPYTWLRVGGPADLLFSPADAEDLATFLAQVPDDVPVTVSGIGTRDAAFVALLSSQMSPEQATLVGIGYTLFAYWFLSLVSFPVVAWQVLAFMRGEKLAPSGGGDYSAGG